MPNPNCQSLLIGRITYIAGTAAVSPAWPPLPPSGWLNAGSDPASLNLADGVMALTAATIWIVEKRVMPAGLAHTVLASSATAAPPAYALPSPLPFCSCSANAAPNAWPAPSASHRCGDGACNVLFLDRNRMHGRALLLARGVVRSSRVDLLYPRPGLAAPVAVPLALTIHRHPSIRQANRTESARFLRLADLARPAVGAYGNIGQAGLGHPAP